MKLTKADFEKYYDKALNWVMKHEEFASHEEMDAKIIGVIEAMKKNDENDFDPITTLFFQIRHDGQIMLDRYATLDEAKKMAQEFANSGKYKKVEIMLAVKYLKPLLEVKRESIYKMF